jgi:hypothetical protein
MSIRYWLSVVSRALSWPNEGCQFPIIGVKVSGANLLAVTHVGEPGMIGQAGVNPTPTRVEK